MLLGTLGSPKVEVIDFDGLHWNHKVKKREFSTRFRPDDVKTIINHNLANTAREFSPRNNKNIQCYESHMRRFFH